MKKLIIQFIKNLGFVILLFGLVITFFTGITIVTREKIVDVGQFEIPAQKNLGLAWSPVIGIVAMIIGAGANACFRLVYAEGIPIK